MELQNVGFYRTVNLITHVAKILLWTILLRVISIVIREISEEQSGFMEDKGSQNVLFVTRLKAKGAVEK